MCREGLGSYPPSCWEDKFAVSAVSRTQKYATISFFFSIDPQEVNFQSFDHFLVRFTAIEFTVDCLSFPAATVSTVER